MSVLLDVFKPNIFKISLAIVIFLVYHIFTYYPVICPLMQFMCEVDPGTQGAIEEDGRYFVPAKTVPLSNTCRSVCTDEEYYSVLTGIVVFSFVIPIFLSYILSSLIIFFASRFRKI